jgi:uncharacterized protein (TIGR03435 family)
VWGTRPVADRTGLDGKYDADLSTPDVGPARGTSATPGRLDVLVAAVRDQLGLKLTAAPVEFRVIAIESAGRPMPD